MVKGWFGALQLSSIDSFDNLGRQFLNQFMDNRWRKRPTTYVLTFKQWEDESLKVYLMRFNKECMTVDNQDKKIMLAEL